MARQTTLVLLLAALAAPATVSGDNLVVNSSFDADCLDWAFSTKVWDMRDHQLSSSSGSCRIDNDSPGATVLSFVQCVPIVAGAEYVLEGWQLIPSGQPLGGSATVGGWWYSDPMCAETFLGGVLNGSISQTGSWLQTSRRHTAPAGARGLSVRAIASKEAGAANFSALFDEIVLVPEPRGAASSLAAGLVLLGIGRARARP